MLLANSGSWEIAIIGLTLTVFTLINVLTKPVHHRTDILLCLLLAILILPLINTVLTELNIHSPLFNKLLNPSLNLLAGPLLLIYVRLLIGERLRLKAIELLHLVPFLGMYFIFINSGITVPLPPGPELINEPLATQRPPSVLLANFGLINALIFIAYAAVTIYALVKHQRNIANVFSQKDTQITLTWIYALPALFVALVLANVMNEEVVEQAYRISPHTLHMLSFASMVTLLCFFGVRQKPVFDALPLSPKRTPKRTQKPTTNLTTATTSEQGQSQELSQAPTGQNEQESTQEKAPKDKAATPKETTLSDALISDIIHRIHTYMADAKPYTDPDFSVYSLAAALDVPRRMLSSALSEGLEKNFYQLVNEYRINEVKHLLANDKEQASTVLDIAFASGFKSKSSFNSLFKQHCQLTPTQYRKSLQ